MKTQSYYLDSLIKYSTQQMEFDFMNSAPAGASQASQYGDDVARSAGRAKGLFSRLGPRGKAIGGLLALGGAAYGGHKGTRAYMAHQVENMSALDRFKTALALLMQPGGVADRIR